jgi:RNA polymerase sigma-70 factor, ECF subfamily
MPLQGSQALADEELVSRVLSGETALYEALVRRYNQRLFRAVRSVIVDDAEAEDVLQEAWVRAFEHLRQFEGRAAFATWVTRIAMHEALARLRKTRRHSPLENTEGEIMPEVERRRQEETPEARAMRRELSRALEAAIDALPEGYRSVFVLRQVEQLSTAETAGCLKLSQEAVKTRLHRSCALLRTQLTERLGESLTAAYSFMGERCDRVTARVLVRIGGRARQGPPNDGRGAAGGSGRNVGA